MDPQLGELYGKAIEHLEDTDLLKEGHNRVSSAEFTAHLISHSHLCLLGALNMAVAGLLLWLPATVSPSPLKHPSLWEHKLKGTLPSIFYPGH